MKTFEQFIIEAKKASYKPKYNAPKQRKVGGYKLPKGYKKPKGYTIKEQSPVGRKIVNTAKVQPYSQYSDKQLKQQMIKLRQGGGFTWRHMAHELIRRKRDKLFNKGVDKLK